MKSPEAEPISEYASSLGRKGGHARWRGISRKKRILLMREVAKHRKRK